MVDVLEQFQKGLLTGKYKIKILENNSAFIVTVVEQETDRTLEICKVEKDSDQLWQY